MVKTRLTGNSNRTEQLTRWLIIIFTVLILAVLWTLFLQNSWGERDLIRSSEEDQLSRSAQLLASQTASLFDRIRTSLQVLAQWIAYNPAKDPLRSDEFRSLAGVFKDPSQGEFDLRFVDSSGGLFYLKRPEGAPLANVHDRDYFMVQQERPNPGFFIGKPVKSRVTKLWGIPLSLALNANQSGFSVIFAALELGRIEPLLKSHQTDPEVTITMVRTDGLIMTRYPFKEDLIGIKPPADPAWAKALGENPEAGILTYHAKLTDGTMKMVAYRRVTGHDMYVVVAQTESTLDKAWQKSFMSQVGYMLGFSTLIVAISVMLLVFHFRLRSIRMQLEDLSRTDPLTGLMNRRSFFERAMVELARGQRNPQGISVWMIDLDQFKSVNDRFGHQVGDSSLVGLARVLGQKVRATDYVARMGGEEFAVIMVPSTIRQAYEAAERARQAVATISLPVGYLSTSIGIACWNGTESLEDLLRRADGALYEAKHSGRNKVVVAESDRQDLF